VVICSYEIVQELFIKHANISSNRKTDSMPETYSKLAEVTPGKE